ncbi:MAG: hypothetical protein COB35_09090 [Gammaproteobacteria bacterium]|nr:MAG: hypothetical protein COB35_09090 [Gammaproteobacteria bacterium]
MTNPEQASNKNSSLTITIIAIVAILAIVVWFMLSKQSEPVTEKVVTVPIAQPQPKIEVPVPVIEEVIPEVVNEPEIVTPEVVEEVKNPLPSLDESDLWLQDKLAAMTWRKELLKLIIDEDMIRRFVVFTDNFVQGQLAYEHSPVVQPQTSFSVKDEDSKPIVQEWQWDEKSTRRFSLYVDLLRSFDSESLVTWYMELKPLIDQAYTELGYDDEDFTSTLQEAITKVLDMEIPKQPLELVRPSVMYKFKDPEIERLDDADKLLLRLGKENLLVIKSVLLEISEKLARKNADR